MDKTQVNCLEKNPAVEKHYSEMTNEQKLAEIDDSLKSAVKIVRNLEKEKVKVMLSKNLIKSKLIQSLIDARISLADRIINVDNMLYRYQNGMLAEEELGLDLKDIKQYLRQQKRELNVLIDSINNAIRVESLKEKVGKS